MQFTNAQLVLPDEIRRGSLIVREGRIARITGGGKPSRRDTSRSLDLEGGYLAPGFIDLHVHGAMGADTMQATEEAFRTIAEFHLRGGTTSIALTTATAPQADILRVLEVAKRFHLTSFGDGARLVGIHVEGPFIAPGKAGAQDPRFIRRPEAREWRRYLRYGRLVTQMTIAPEIPGAMALIKALRKNGSIASGGHTDATDEHLSLALAA